MNHIKVHNYFSRKFEVANQPEDQWEIFSQEMYGDFNYTLSDLPEEVWKDFQNEFLDNHGNSTIRS